MRIITAALLISILILATPTPASAQGLDLQYRQRTEERLMALDRQMQDLTGQVERQQFQLRQAEQRIEVLSSELASARAGLPGGAAAEGPGARPAQEPATAMPPGAPTDGAGLGQPLPSGAAQEEYDAAYGLLGQGKFAGGEAAFRTFLKRYPDHQLTSNARYWIGETLYARQSYQEAAKAFLEAWQADQRGTKAPDNLLKLAMSLERLDKKQEACATYAKLLSDYRGAPERLRSAASRERQSLGCS